MGNTRRLRRFFLSESIPSVGHTVRLPKGESHHLKNINRLKPGDTCLLCDGGGAEAEAVIQDFVDGTLVELKVESLLPQKVKEGMYIRVLQAIAKKGKIEFLIEKAQEFGVEEFLPVESERSEIKIKVDQREKVEQRWNKKVVEAAKQSGELDLLRIRSLQSLKEAVKSVPLDEWLLIFHPESGAKHFSEWVKGRIADLEEDSGRRTCVNLLFGPEGGFSQEEIHWLMESRRESKGMSQILELGDNILRLETACLGVIATVRLMINEK